VRLVYFIDAWQVPLLGFIISVFNELLFFFRMSLISENLNELSKVISLLSVLA
jgi:hypothetical protein